MSLGLLYDEFELFVGNWEQSPITSCVEMSLFDESTADNALRQSKIVSHFDDHGVSGILVERFELCGGENAALADIVFKLSHVRECAPASHLLDLTHR